MLDAQDRPIPRQEQTALGLPSPTLPTLHAMHYHTAMFARQDEIKRGGCPWYTLRKTAGRFPYLRGATCLTADIAQEVENNAQGILGYVVRWVDQGVGLSKVRTSMTSA